MQDEAEQKAKIDREQANELEYSSVTLEEAEHNLGLFAEKWRRQYPSCVKSWEENWEVLSTFFDYPPGVRQTRNVSRTVPSVVHNS